MNLTELLGPVPEPLNRFDAIVEAVESGNPAELDKALEINQEVINGIIREAKATVRRYLKTRQSLESFRWKLYLETDFKPDSIQELAAGRMEGAGQNE